MLPILLDCRKYFGLLLALCLMARYRSRRIAPGSRLLCRRSQRELRLRSLLRSTAARDPLFDCSLPLAAMFAGLPPWGGAEVPDLFRANNSSRPLRQTSPTR
jgi:hypothetical protein